MLNIPRISQKMVILKVNELFVLETTLLATFQYFLPKGDQEEILPGDDLSGLDSLALSAVFMSSTISQDETSGKSGREMQILEDFFQVMRSAKKMNQPPEDVSSILATIPLLRINANFCYFYRPKCYSGMKILTTMIRKMMTQSRSSPPLMR